MYAQPAKATAPALRPSEEASRDSMLIQDQKMYLAILNKCIQVQLEAFSNVCQVLVELH